MESAVKVEKSTSIISGELCYSPELGRLIFLSDTNSFVIDLTLDNLKKVVNGLPVKLEVNIRY